MCCVVLFYDSRKLAYRFFLLSVIQMSKVINANVILLQLMYCVVFFGDIIRRITVHVFHVVKT